ncbi:MAG: thermonuclease family protein, partial [Pseudonocardiaceae bacterium]
MAYGARLYSGIVVAGAILLGACTGVGTSGNAGTTSTTVAVSKAGGASHGAAESVVASITDGDTLRIQDGTRIRLIGIDTPERGDCYFTEATARMAALVPPGTRVRLEYDVERTDRYGRELAYVYRLPDQLFVNEAMAAEGFALQLTIAPDVEHAETFRVAVASA